MRGVVRLQSIIAVGPSDRLAVFALLGLGVAESLTCGLLSASDAVRGFFHADNCLFVRKHLHDKLADEVMSRGAQLPDLFEALSAEEAQREFQQEVAVIRSLCRELLQRRRSVA
jgi:hypothetical protein